MVLEHVGMPQPGDCRVVFSASAKELNAAIQAEQTAENPPQAEEDLLTAAVNRAILTGFSTLYQELVEKERLVPVTDPDFELLAVNRAEGFRAGAEFYCLPPLELDSKLLRYDPVLLHLQIPVDGISGTTPYMTCCFSSLSYARL